MMTVQLADTNHVQQIADIWNYYIENTTHTFNPIKKTQGDIETLIQSNTPLLIALNGTDVTGFGLYGNFRNGAGYARVKEHSIHLHPDHTGQGIGRNLLTALETHARENNVQSFFAGISGENENAIAFHLACGYHHVTRIEKVGYKFDRYVDLVLMRKLL